MAPFCVRGKIACRRSKILANIAQLEAEAGV
jgi:hypothetical protein